MAVALVPPSMSFTIRPFAEADRPAIKALWRIAFAEFPDDPDTSIDFCLRSGHGVLFVGCVDGNVIGTILAGHDGHRGWAYHLATHPEHCGRGYARRLVARAETFLAGLGVPKINLQIRTENAAVQDFYARLGYEAEPRIQMGKRFSKTPPIQLAGAEGDGMLEISITYLEMLRRPRLPAPPPPALRLAVMRADAVSVPFYRYLYDTVGAPWLWYERRTMSDADLAAAIQHPDVDVFVLFAGGEPAGYAELDRRRMPDIELAYFGLVPAFIGRKLGPWLLHWAVDAAWAREPKRVWVHTCSLDHPKAIAHYQRAGFSPYRQERKAIADPRPLL
jgi:GNAT superfamily N-acetyltransferase